MPFHGNANVPVASGGGGVGVYVGRLAKRGLPDIRMVKTAVERKENKSESHEMKTF